MKRLFALMWLSVVAALIGNILPVFLGVLAEAFALEGSQLGVLGGVELGGSCLASLSASYWFTRANLRIVAVFGISAALLGNLGTGYVSDYEMLVLVRFFTGACGSGVLYAMVLGLIGQERHPERLLAVAVVLHVISLAAGLWAVPLIMANWHIQGVTLGVALLYLAAYPLIAALPQDAKKAPSVTGLSSENHSLLPYALLGCLIVYTVGLGGLWAFLERIGSITGYAMTRVGSALALASLVGGLGAVLAAVLGSRFGHRLPLLCAILIQAVCALVLATRDDWPSYLLAIYCFSFCWNLALPYLMGAVATSDPTGRCMVLVPAAQTGGLAAGPILIGLVMTGDNYQIAAWVSMSVFLLCLSMVAVFTRGLSRDVQSIDSSVHQ